jgi:small neutral amino acid transporter SnatA (MarC family)
MGLLLAALAIKFIREGVLGVISTAMMTTGRP